MLIRDNFKECLQKTLRADCEEKSISSGDISLIRFLTFVSRKKVANKLRYVSFKHTLTIGVNLKYLYNIAQNFLKIFITCVSFTLENLF